MENPVIRIGPAEARKRLEIDASGYQRPKIVVDPGNSQEPIFEVAEWHVDGRESGSACGSLAVLASPRVVEMEGVLPRKNVSRLNGRQVSAGLNRKNTFP